MPAARKNRAAMLKSPSERIFTKPLQQRDSGFKSSEKKGGIKAKGLAHSDKSVPDLKFGTPLAPRKKGIGFGRNYLDQKNTSSAATSQATAPKKKQIARTTHNTRPSSPSGNFN